MRPRPVPYPRPRPYPEGTPPSELPRRSVPNGVGAWREWRLLRHLESGDYAIGSLRFPVVWEGPVLYADGPILHPGATDQPGIHAWRYSRSWPRPSEPGIRGSLLLYGTVLAYESGYKAEHAIVRDLFLFYTRDLPGRAAPSDPLLWSAVDSEALRDWGWTEVSTVGLPPGEAMRAAWCLSRRYDCEVIERELTPGEGEDV